MLKNRVYRITSLFIILILSSSFVFAVPEGTAIKFLNEANSLYQKDDIEGAYKYINQAISLSEESIEKSRHNNDKSHVQALEESILYFAQSVYFKKLEMINNSYDELGLLDIKANLERHPRLYNPSIKKLISAIESKIENPDKEASDYMEKLYELEEEREMIAESKYEFAFSEIDENKTIDEDFIKDTAKAKESKKVIVITLISLSLILIAIALVIIIVWKRRFTHKTLQQEQYIQAFKVMAKNTNQAEENISILETAKDIYSSKKDKENEEKIETEKDEKKEDVSRNNGWSVSSPIQSVNITKSDEEELQKLAIKCEELGNRIDSVTGRKNNSKNVSEVVYKLSLELGISPAMSMVNFCAAMVYDAGFLGIDQDILNSISLNEEEKEAMKTHVNLARRYIKFVPKKYMNIFESACTKHHENMDGSGYPRGLQGGEIPQIARLIRVAESYISMSSKRLYRAPIDKEAAVEKLKEMPEFYDPVVVEALEKIV